MLSGYASMPSWWERACAEFGDDHPAVRAALRVDHRLTYDRTSEPRPILGGTMDGPDVPNAYGSGEASDVQVGEWFGGELPEDATEENWVEHYASMAVAEAVHEALEFFKVDGKPWLDPHGDHENRIHMLCEEFAEQLAALQRGER